jgi:hypothetical protein
MFPLLCVGLETNSLSYAFLDSYNALVLVLLSTVEIEARFRSKSTFRMSVKLTPMPAGAIG